MLYVAQEAARRRIGQTVHALRLHHNARTEPRFLAADQLAKAVNLGWSHCL
jgi:hypothetical protein